MNRSSDQGSFVIIDIEISSEEFLQHYQGSVSQVSAVSRDGRNVRFPSRILQPYITREGIKGSFVIRFDSQHKFAGIDKIP